MLVVMLFLPLSLIFLSACSLSKLESLSISLLNASQNEWPFSRADGVDHSMSASLGTPTGSSSDASDISSVQKSS
jgi:hypothetical protein